MERREGSSGTSNRCPKEATCWSRLGRRRVRGASGRERGGRWAEDAILSQPSPPNPLCPGISPKPTNTRSRPPGPRTGAPREGSASRLDSFAHPATGSLFSNASLPGPFIRPTSASCPLQALGPVLSPGGPGGEPDMWGPCLQEAAVLSGGRRGRTDALPRCSVCRLWGSALRPLASSISYRFVRSLNNKHLLRARHRDSCRYLVHRIKEGTPRSTDSPGPPSWGAGPRQCWEAGDGGSGSRHLGHRVG